MGSAIAKPRPAQGARFAALRKAAGLSQAELAKALGVPQSSIGFWETAAKPSRSDILPKLAEALGVRVEDLLDCATSAAPGRPGRMARYGALSSRRPCCRDVSRSWWWSSPPEIMPTLRKKPPAPPNAEPFGERLARLRHEAGYSQRQLVAQLGISQRMIAYSEKQTDRPPADLLPLLSSVLGLSTDQLSNDLAPAFQSFGSSPRWPFHTVITLMRSRFWSTSK